MTSKHQNTSSERFELYLRDSSTLVVGSIVGAMLLLTVAVCTKTRIIDKKHEEGHQEGVNINHEFDDEEEAEYSLVKNEKCYVDLPLEKYDLLGSQRQRKECISCEESSYDHCQNARSMYDISGKVHTLDVLNTENEYELM